jgi:hypothetical protein
MVSDVPDLAEARRALRVLRDSCGLDETPPPDVVTRREVMRFRAIADALLLLLPPGPAVETTDRHAVNDVPPSPGTHETPDGEKWTWSWEHVQVMVEHDVEPENRYPVILTKAAYKWLSVEDAEAVAAELLSAAARARTHQETDRG